MKRRTFFTGVALVCATVVLSAGLIAQEKSYEEMSPEKQAMMEAWMKYGTPGKPHERLAEKVGEWTLHGKFWHAPGTDAEEFEGTAKIKAIMGGRYFVEKVKGPGHMEGMEFEGLGLSGYDNLTESFVGIWIDNTKTGILHYEGTPSGDGKTLHFSGQTPDPLTGGYKKTRSVEEKVNDDKYISTEYKTAPDGQEFKHMELVYERVK